jgi:hypothetical protein
MSIGMVGVELPVVVLAEIPDGAFKGDCIVGDKCGNIGILSAECMKDAGIDLFRGGPKRYAVEERYQVVSVPRISARFIKGGDTFVETFDYETMQLQKLLIDEQYILKCGFSQRLNTWFVSGDVRVREPQWIHAE